MRRGVVLVASWLSAWCLVLAAVAKVVDPRAFQLQILGVLEGQLWLTAAAACVLPPFEIAVAAQLLWPAWRRGGALQLLALNVGFALWQLFLLVGGHDDCGCFGSWLTYSPWVGLIGNVSLMAMAILILRNRRASSER